MVASDACFTFPSCHHIQQLISEDGLRAIKEVMRILAIDPGDKNIGLAISDPTGTIATPLTILRHTSRTVDAATIVAIARENHVELIIVGQALDADNRPTPQSRKAARLAESIRSQTNTSVLLWDESDTTRVARQAVLLSGAPRSKRKGHFDDLAATYLLQTYLDSITEKRGVENQH